MRLCGSCHCQKVKFEIESKHPYPFNLCYCGICRKTAGGGGFAINLGGNAVSMQVVGQQHISIYRAKLEKEAEPSLCERRFCKHCGSALWVWDPRWPDLIHPFASTIDSALPVPPERTHLMVGSKSEWVDINAKEEDLIFEEYPIESLQEWHERHDLEK